MCVGERESSSYSMDEAKQFKMSVTWLETEPLSSTTTIFLQLLANLCANKVFSTAETPLQRALLSDKYLADDDY